MKATTERSLVNVATAVMIALLVLMMCALIELLEGCTTHRHVTATTSTDSVATRVHTAVTEATDTQTITSVGHFMADSLWASLSADSVVTPSGVIIYRPIFTAGALRPQSATLGAATMVATTLTSSTDSTHTHATAAAATDNNTSATAIAKPPDGNGMWWVIGASTLAALVIGAYRWRKMK